MLFTVGDVETSGLDVHCSVHSFSYVLMDEWLSVKRAETLYFWKEGETKWTEEAYAVHGLSKEFLRQYEDQFEDNLKKMYIVLHMSDFVGYNSGYVGSDNLLHGFDLQVCRNFLENFGLPVPVPVGMYDVMRLIMPVHKKRIKLTRAVVEWGIDPNLVQAFMVTYFKQEGRAHESSYDVICTALLFQKLCAEGYVDVGNKMPASFKRTVEDRAIEEHKIVIEDSGDITIEDIYDGTQYTLDDFSNKHPEAFKKMMENPNAYM